VLAEILALEGLTKDSLDLGDSAGSSDEDDFVNLVNSEAGFNNASLNRGSDLSEQIFTEFSKLSLGQVESEIFAFSEGFTLNVSRLDLGDSSLGLLNLEAEFLKGSLVAKNINLRFSLKFFLAEVNESGVEVVSSEVLIAVSGSDFEDTVLNVDDRDIEGTTTEIEDHDVTFLSVLLVKAVSDGSSGGLVNDSLNSKAGKSSSILGSLSLGVVEMSGHGNDGVSHFLINEGLSHVFHLGKNNGGKFFGAHSLGLSLVGDDN